MKLNKILKACDFKMEVSENLDFNIKGLSIHSKSVKDNYIFGAIKGNKQNGEDFVADLQHIKNLVVVISKNSFVDRNFKKSGNIIFIKVNDVRFFISKICSIIFPNNSSIPFEINNLYFFSIKSLYSPSPAILIFKFFISFIFSKH